MAYVVDDLPGVNLVGFELLVDSGVTVGSGLSSSGAVEIGPIVTLNNLFSLDWLRSAWLG